jgi:hypothetical protein
MNRGNSDNRINDLQERTSNFLILQNSFLMLQEWDRELHFSMVDGDFKKFEGKWSVKSGTR